MLLLSNLLCFGIAFVTTSAHLKSDDCTVTVESKQYDLSLLSGHYYAIEDSNNTQFVYNLTFCTNSINCLCCVKCEPTCDNTGTGYCSEDGSTIQINPESSNENTDCTATIGYWPSSSNDINVTNITYNGYSGIEFTLDGDNTCYGGPGNDLHSSIYQLYCDESMINTNQLLKVESGKQISLIPSIFQFKMYTSVTCNSKYSNHTDYIGTMTLIKGDYTDDIDVDMQGIEIKITQNGDKNGVNDVTISITTEYLGDFDVFPCELTNNEGKTRYYGDAYTDQSYQGVFVIIIEETNELKGMFYYQDDSIYSIQAEPIDQ